MRTKAYSLMLAVGLWAGAAGAGTYYYDNNAGTAGFGTASGTWLAPTPGPTPGWTTDGTGSTVPGSVTTLTGDALNFGNGGTGLAAGTITISGTVNASNMTFAAGSGAITLSGGTINLAPAVTITLNNAADTISSILAGVATPVNKVGIGNLTLTGANTYGGATTLYAGTFTLGGASGVIASTSVAVFGGTLSLDNSTAWTNRIPDAAAVSLGTLTLISTNGAGAHTETVGDTTFGTSGKITINNGTTGGDQTTLALGAVTRSAGAAIDVVGTGGTLGAGANSPNVTSTGSWPGAVNGILPYATVGGTQWAEDNANSIRAYTGAFVALPGATSAQNTQVTGSLALGGAAVGNSLNLVCSGAGQGLNLGANNLTLGSAAGSAAAILKSGTDAYSITGTGQVRAGSGGAGTELITHVDGGELTIGAPLNTAIVGLAKGGTGKLILSGTRAGTFSGNISIAGTVEFQGLGTSFNGAISGSGGLTVNLNSGQKLIFNSTAITYSGPTVVKGGILQIGTWYGGGSCFPTVPGGGLYSAGQGLLSNLELNGGSLGVWYYMSEFLGSGPGQIQLTGGTCGFNMYQGDAGGASWTINADANYEVVWGSTYFKPDVLLLSDTSVTGTGATFWIPNKIDLNGATRTVRVDSTAVVGGRLPGVIRNSSGTPAGLTKIGVGELQLTGANTFNGGVTINGGTLTLGHVSALGSSSGAVTFTGAATLNLATFSPTVGALSSASGYGTIRASGAVTLTVSQTNNTTYSGVIQDGSGAVSLVKSGSGTLALSGTNTYTGATTVTNGTLTGVTGGSCANSAVTVTNTPGNTAALGVVVTSNTMQWTCASLTFKTNEVGAQLKFSFAVAPSPTLAPLNIAGDLVFSGAPLVVVDPANLLGGKTYPLLVVGGTPPTEVPPLSLQGTPGLLAWGGAGNKTLSLILANSGTVVVVR